MAATSSVDVLNRLLAIVYRSLPVYLADAHTWHAEGDTRATTVLDTIVLDQKQSAGRIIQLLDSRRAPIEPGEFPMDFTDTQMLSLDFLLTELIHYQRQDVASIERCVAELAGDAAAHALAQEVLGSERAHLDALRSLSAKSA